MKKLVPILSVIIVLCLGFASCAPETDKDKDGVFDEDDECLDVYGEKSFKGCPDVSKIHLYFDDSKSNAGYLRGQSLYQQVAVDFINYTSLGDTTDYSFIHDVVEPSQKNPNEMMDYITKEGGYNKSCSEIHKMVEQILLKNNKNDISILITDGILSSCNGGDSKNHIALQALVFKSIKDKNVATIVTRLESDFDGLYYIEAQKDLVGKTIKTKRPFYVFIFGNKQVIPAFREKVLSKIKNFSTKHQLSFGLDSKNEEETITKCYIVREGNNKQWKDKGQTITDIENTAKVTVSIAVNFGMLDIDLQNCDTLKKLLKCSNSKCRIVDIQPTKTVINNYKKDNTKEALQKNTHFVTLELTDLISKEEVLLTIPKPNWYEKLSTDDDSTPDDGKTYFLKYLIGGITEAYSKNTTGGTNLVAIPISFSK